MSSSVIFHNKGALDIRGVTTFGISAKEGDNPIGKFGTGLKYAIAVCLRHNQKISFFAHGMYHEFGTREEEMRGKKYEQVTMTVTSPGQEKSPTIDLPFTTLLGQNWELWQAFRELYSNMLDEGGECFPVTEDWYEIYEDDTTTIVVTGEEFVQILFDKGDVFLTSKPKISAPNLDIHEGESKAVFHKGIRVAEFEKPLMHKYDIKGYADLTEDRTLACNWMFDRQVTSTVANSNDQDFITKMVTAPKDYHESGLNYDNVSVPSDTFLKTVKGLIKRAKDKVNPTVVRLYEEYVRKKRKESKVRRVSFTVSVDLPGGVTPKQMKEQLQSWWKIPELHDLNLTISHRDDDDNNIPF